jgi:NTP pyrophosphatase (non-canonical NTP hydrolase)
MNDKQKSRETLPIFNKIRTWSNDNGLFESGDAKTQTVKLTEEVGELARALLRNKENDVKDAIGDIVIVLTNLAYMRRLLIEDCIEDAYYEIKDREGQIVDGNFIKYD